MRREKSDPLYVNKIITDLDLLTTEGYVEVSERKGTILTDSGEGTCSYANAT